jgi:hypothetical protein
VKFNVPQEAGDAIVGLVLIDEEAFYSAALNPSSPLPSTPVLIQAYRSTNDKSALSLADLSFAFLLREDDRLEVEESFVIRNGGQQSVRSAGPKDEIYRISLPRQVFNFRYGQGFNQETTRIEGNDLIFTGSLAPGDHYFSLAYEIDQARFSFEFEKKFSLPVSRVDAFLNDPQLRLPGFSMSSNQKFYAGVWGQVWTMYLDSARHEFKIQLQGLPARIPWTWWLPYVCLALFLLIWACLGRLRTPRHSYAEQQKEVLLDRLAKLRKLKERSLISSKDYENKRLSLLEQLVPHYSQENANRRTSI